jgi:ABC-2 type transport system ATP-binding protein
MNRKLAIVAVLLALVASIQAPVAQAAEGDTAENVTVTSLAADQIDVAITVFKPAAASAENQVPVIFESHGWGGSRTTSIGGAVEGLLNAGFGVVSIDQRGHGETGGLRNVQDPNLEAQDIKAVIDYTAGLDWVQLNVDETGAPIAGDPVLGAIGGSYGGGYQTITALTELRESGHTRFDALAPEITWYDLPEALAPQGVARTAWNLLLYGVAKAENKMPAFIDQGFAYGTATGQWPDGTVPVVPNLDQIFTEHSPIAFVEDGIKLDMPVLVRQGITDNLFNLNQGLHIFDKAVTDEARAKSLFVGYNGGHVLPAVGSTLPQGTAPAGDACSAELAGGWGQLRIDFFKTAFSGGDTSALLPSQYNLSTETNTCLHLDALPAGNGLTQYEVDPSGLGGWGTPVGPTPPVSYELADGPLTVAGIPKLTGQLYAAAADTRAFFALSIGTSISDAKVIQNNVMPLRSLLPATGDDFEIELPGIAAEVPEGKKLFLTVSGVSDQSFGHSSKTPGLMVMMNMTARVPVVGP